MALDEHQADTIGTLETRKDAGKGPQGVLKFWLMELRAADKLEHDYRENGMEIDRRYEAEEAWARNWANDDRSGRLGNGMVSHNILYSNVQTMLPALYDSTPVPDIRRRFRDADPVGKQVAEMLERAAQYQIEMNDMDSVMEEVILDHLLPGRGLARLNYEPTFRTVPEQRAPFNPNTFDGTTGSPDVPENAVADEQGNIFTVTPEREVIADEQVNIVYVPWNNFRVSPAKTWADVRWIAFDWYLTKEQITRMFPGKDIPLDTQTRESFVKDQDFSDVPSVFKRAYVREIWDKKKREVVFIAPSFKEGPLRVDEDPLRLQDFFPMPRPIYSVKQRKSMIPVPDFFQYASQAVELDMITKRIQGLIRALRLRGVYDSTLTEMGRISRLNDNEYIPVENVNHYLDKGGLENAIFTMPIEEAAKVLANLYLQRDQVKDTIFEITGLSDIIRGVSDPNETLGAQNIKTQFGSLRINRRQREVQRYARDIIRIMVEIMAEHFQPETLQRITQKEVTPEMVQVMKSDQLRSYRIDIETDSTIAKQIQDEEENYTKLLNAIAQFVQMVSPMVIQGFFPIEVAVSLLQSGIRRFKMGRSVEDAFENIDIEQAKASIEQQNQDRRDPEAEAKAQELQIKAKEMEQKIVAQAQKTQVDAQSDQAKMNLDSQKAAAEIQLKQQELQQEREIEFAKIAASMLKDNGEGEGESSTEEVRELTAAIKQLMDNFNVQRQQVN